MATRTEEHTDDPFPVGCRVRYEGIWPTGEHPTGTVIPLAKFAPDDGRKTVQWDDERVSTEEQSWLTRIDSEPDPVDPDIPAAAPEDENERLRQAYNAETMRSRAGAPTFDTEAQDRAVDAFMERVAAAPAPESSTDPGEGEADEFTEARRRVHHLIDEYGLAGVTSLVQEHPDAAQLAAIPTVPEGHEVVVLPSETVDWYVKNEVPDPDLTIACRAAVARRPKPTTERVPWWEAVGRTEPAGNVIEQVGFDEDGPYICTIANGTRLRSLVEDGTVLVLAEDGES